MEEYSGDDAGAMDFWISCVEQMPPEKERVLCVTVIGIKILLLHPPFIGVRHMHPSDWIGESASSIVQRMKLEDVTHWMPLPKLPNANVSGLAPGKD